MIKPPNDIATSSPSEFHRAPFSMRFASMSCWCSRASLGTNGRSWGELCLPESSSQQLPEFGLRAKRVLGLRFDKSMGQTASRRSTEHTQVLSWLWNVRLQMAVSSTATESFGRSKTKTTAMLHLRTKSENRGERKVASQQSGRAVISVQRIDNL